MGILKRIKQLVRANTTEFRQQSQEVDLFGLQPGDMLNIEGIDYEVTARLGMNDHGWRWMEYRLQDIKRPHWLSVEQDDELEISLYEEISPTVHDVPKQCTIDGIEYFLQESGTAVVEEVEGKINVLPANRVKYHEYTDRSEEHYFAIEVWDGEVETSVGRPIRKYDIEIFAQPRQ